MRATEFFVSPFFSIPFSKDSMIKRPDRRTDSNQLRQFTAAQNVLHQADGSARFDIGIVY